MTKNMLERILKDLLENMLERIKKYISENMFKKYIRMNL